MPGRPLGSGSGGGGGGLILRVPPDEFTGGTLAEAIAARDHAVTGITDTGPFDDNPNLAVLLTATDPDPDLTYYSVRRGNAWANVTNTVRGPQGPGPTDAEITALVAGFARTPPVGTAPLGVLPAALALDTEVTAAIDALKGGRLGYDWRYAVKRTQDFGGDDFVHMLESVSSGFPELTTPAFADANTFFGAIAIPLAEPEASVEEDRFFGAPILNEYNYRRRATPLYILDVPHRVWIGRFYLNPRSGSEQPLKLIPKLRLSAYARYAIATATAAVPAFDDAWEKSYSPVVPVGAYSGSRFVHLLLPHGTAPAPTFVSWAADAAANIANSFAASGIIQMVDGVPYAEYSSDAAIDQPADIEDLVVLPERALIRYFSPPTVLDNSDLGFTWYAGLYSYDLGPPPAHPENPVTAALITAGAHLVAVTTPQVTYPDDGRDLGTNSEYIPVPGANVRYVRYVAQPAAQDDFTGILNIDPDALTYETEAAIKTSGEAAFLSQWTLQVDTVEISGVTHKVWLNRLSTTRHNTAFNASTIYTWRG